MGCPELDRVFFGANHLNPSAGRSNPAIEIKVIGQSLSRLEFQPAGPQHRKEGVWPGDAGHGHQPATAQIVQRQALAIGSLHVSGQRAAGREAGDERGSALRREGVEYQVHRARPRLAQRACRQKEAVARTALVEHADFDIAAQRQVLQAVVADDHVRFGVGLAQRLGGLHALWCDEDRCGRGTAHQQGLITGLFRRAVRGHLTAVIADAAVASRDDAGTQTAFLQVAHHGNHGGRLAGPAGHDIAHHDHRHAGMLRTQQAPGKGLPAQGDDQAHQQGNRPQQPGHQSAVQPRLLQARTRRGPVTGHRKGRQTRGRVR